MLYCNNCAKLLDEDVQFCPICNEEDPSWQEPDTANNEFVQQGAFKGEAFDKLREINQHIEENPIPDIPKIAEAEEKPGAGAYIALISLSVCFSIGGLILGIMYATRQNKHFQALGIVTIVISLVFLLLGLMLSIALMFMINIL